MADRRRLVLLGGSSAFTPQLAAELAERAAHLPALELWLVGRRERATRATARFCSLVARARGADHRYCASVEPDRAFEGADLILSGARVGGFEGREFDERIGHACGLPGDETIGPGGLSAAVRSLPVVLDLARRAARAAPDAPTLLLSNPLGVLAAALAAEPGVRAVGLCELPEVTLIEACRRIGVDAAEVEADYIGLNHQGAFTSIRDRDGVELIGAVLEAIAAEGPAAEVFGVEPAAMGARGDLPVSYLRLYEHRERELARQRRRSASRGAELGRIADELHRHFERTDDPQLPPALLSRAMPWNRLAVVPAIEAIFDGRPRRLAVTEANRGHLPGVAATAPVEKWGRQVPFGEPPPAPRTAGAGAERNLAFARELADYEALALAAAREPSASALEAALTAHPWGVPAADCRALADAIVPTPKGALA